MAARRATMARTPAAPCAPSPFLSVAGASRGAAKVSAPIPLSIRYDSLFVKCMIAAVVYFVPQDAVFLTGLVWDWHNPAARVSPKRKPADAESALADFKAKKGLEDVRVS